VLAWLGNLLLQIRNKNVNIFSKPPWDKYKCVYITCNFVSIFTKNCNKQLTYNCVDGNSGENSQENNMYLLIIVLMFENFLGHI